MIDQDLVACSNKKDRWSFVEDEYVIKFDIQITASKRYIWVRYFRKTGVPKVMAAAVDKKVIQLHCNKTRKILGDPGGEDSIRASVTALNWEMK